jgi:hypothetical protein
MLEATYANPITSKREFKVGENFIFRANPKQPKLKDGDVIELKLEGTSFAYGKAVVIVDSTLAAYSYRARRTE